MKYLIVLAFSLVSINSYCQETKPSFDGHTWKAPYYLETPEGWSIERFLIPISFAPGIPYKGVEDIRFSPGWAKGNSDEYWSYAFLWYLDSLPEINAQIIAANLKEYYTGLFAANTDSARLKKAPGKIVPVSTQFIKIATAKGDIETFNGTIEMTDYIQLKPVFLNCVVHVRSCPGDNKAYLFFELSPQPFTHRIWLDLNKLWTNFKCKVN